MFGAIAFVTQDHSGTPQHPRGSTGRLAAMRKPGGAHTQTERLKVLISAAAGARASELEARACALIAVAESASSGAPPAAERPSGASRAGCRQAKKKKGRRACGGGGVDREPCGAQGSGAARLGAALGHVVWAREKGWSAWPALVVSAGDAAAAAPQLSRADPTC